MKMFFTVANAPVNFTDITCSMWPHELSNDSNAACNNSWPNGIIKDVPTVLLVCVAFAATIFVLLELEFVFETLVLDELGKSLFFATDSNFLFRFPFEIAADPERIIL